MVEEGVESFEVFFPKNDIIGEVISATLRKDAITKPVDALLEITARCVPAIRRPYRPLITCSKVCSSMPAGSIRVGRLKFNIKMGRPEKDCIADPLLAPTDFVEVVNYLLRK